MNDMTFRAHPGQVVGDPVPLVVDMNGTLVLGDLLHESALKLARQHPLAALRIPLWLLRGRARVKSEIAQRVNIDAATLPYGEGLLAWLKAQKASGRRLVLCTASNERYAAEVASHLGLFDEVIASDAHVNVSAGRKAEILAERFGEHGFDYAGNSNDDLQVWAHARHVILVNTRPRLTGAAREKFEVLAEFSENSASVRTWLRALRLHQWLKNLLVLLPLAGAFQLDDEQLLLQAGVAFLAFGLCASGVYVLNDLMDLENDRAHPRKRERPFASGALSPVAGLAAAGLLLVAAGLLAAWSRPAFQLALASYFALTLAYTFLLKRKVIIDCLALGGLYTMRIVAGWSAVGLPASFWLLGFSLFLFLSLAFVKRYSELRLAARLGRPDAAGRGYLASDLPLVQTMGVAAGFGSAMLLALYINGDTVLRLYSHPELLWLLVPIHLYWVSRMWMQAERGHMHDDPLVFAVRDWISLICALLFGLTLVIAR
jgi:4-hydroxybenzoate polyprenyltransferase